MTEGPILGIWDGHDAGAALVDGSRILFAVNEERLSRRKLEVGFPRRSIDSILQHCAVAPSDIRTVAFSTSDFGKTLSRLRPGLREEYYLIRRRKKSAGILTAQKKLAKYWLTEIPPFWITRELSLRRIAADLRIAGFAEPKLCLTGHHEAHAAGAAFCSGFERSLVVTIDGIGDGLSGSFWTLDSGRLTHLSNISGRTSLGIFFEHVTNLLNMRELEDEGKVMALANFACPIPDTENPLLKFFTVDGLQLRARYSSLRMYRELRKILWHYPSEQFAYLSQRMLERTVVELVRNALRATGMSKVAYAGGVASNVKVNMLLADEPAVEQLFVFPHMGDGGLALGAALWCRAAQVGSLTVDLPDVYFGPQYTEEQITAAIGKFPGFRYHKPGDIADAASELLERGEIIFWFDGRMEYGPRALGARSILARADSAEIKDKLNLRLKNRVWYQPFCPVMLEQDAARLLQNYNGVPNPFMTCAYRVKQEARRETAGVINVDGTCRPQIVADSDCTAYAAVLRRYKERTGSGVLLNTSFNLHGEPLVCSPEDALQTFAGTAVRWMVMQGLLVEKPLAEAQGAA